MRFISAVFLWIFAAVGLFTVILGGIGASLVMSHMDDGAEDSLPDRMILTLSLDGTWPEQELGGDPLRDLVQGGPPALTLRQLSDTLTQAATDPEVVGVLAYVSSGPTSLSQAQELRDAISAFRLSGKPAWVYSDSIGELGGGLIGYYTASAFDRIALQPTGGVGITGLSIQAPYARGLLDRLGVLPQFETREEFKTGVANFTDYTLSGPQYRMWDTLVGDFYDATVMDIAQSRNISPEDVRAAVDAAPLQAAEAQERRLIDILTYRDVLEDRFRKQTDADELVPLSHYAATVPAAAPTEEPGDVPAQRQKIAVLFLTGGIHRDSTAPEGGDLPVFGAEPTGIIPSEVIAALDAAVDDPDVAAVILRIESPGGSYLGSDAIHAAILRAREKGMPVIASLGQVAASGGYFIAMASDSIIAQPGSITGSIGVIAGKFVLDGLWRELEVSWDGVSRGKNANFMNPNTPFVGESQAKIDSLTDAIYADFLAKLRENRNLSASEADAVAGGRVVSGARALSLGLVDANGGWTQTLSTVREAAKIPPETELHLVRFPE
ncbi:MAG: S49 family peptidase, partial [Rhodospirillaceae bacterium]